MAMVVVPGKEGGTRKKNFPQVMRWTLDWDEEG